MQARNMILTAVIGGPLVGMLLGIAAHPTMTPPPEPSWRSARPDPIYSKDPQRIVDYGPQDLSPNWFVDRTPTWKRRAAEREAAAYARLQYADYVPEPLPPPEPEAEAQPPSQMKIVTWPKTPMDEAAEARNAERDAQAAAGEARSAAAEPAEREAEPTVDPAAPAL
ncbi:hypothetical protein KRR38_24960 [Novosphingobium sp. G106]|uniref:hypothetical protein n=1 Tax=Novosphingobium sp. G106 TaxID=2849500 RepID=UPI001C2DBA27|nr:hypothetical protein [Novosphingobium sp. G106]MBV1690839.1 hypothetical protein [Novosphingobium sp. G106]